MKNIVIGFALSVLALQSANAQSTGSNATGLYLGATAGVHFYDDDDGADLDVGNGGSLGAQLGYRFSDNLRAELQGEVTGAEINDSDNGDLIFGRATVGVYYDFQGNNYGFVPYFGGGIGIASGTVEGFSDDIEEDVDIEEVLTWHAEAGISLNLNAHIAIAPSYRYTYINSDEGDLDDFTSHALRVGIVVGF